jgi:hypothetical protein
VSWLTGLDHDGGRDQPGHQCGHGRPPATAPDGGVHGDRPHQHDADHDVLRRGESMFRNTIPERSDCMMTAPSTAPGTVPMPPEDDVPPMTAATNLFRRSGDHFDRPTAASGMSRITTRVPHGRG